MCLERFDEALVLYDDIGKHDFEGEDFVLLEVYNFNEELLVSNPEHIQSHFIIGFLKYKKDANYPEAFDCFNRFLNKSINKNQYSVLIKEAKRYTEELENKMNLK